MNNALKTKKKVLPARHDNEFGQNAKNPEVIANGLSGSALNAAANPHFLTLKLPLLQILMRERVEKVEWRCPMSR